MLKRQSSHHLQLTHKFRLSLAFVYCTVGATHERYIPSRRPQPGSDGQIPLNLAADIETIPCAADNLVLPAYTDEQKAVVQLGCTAYDFSLSHAVIGFLRNQIHGAATMEPALRSRNDYFLDIIRIVAATGTAYSMMDMTREANYPSSQTAPNGAIYQREYPELVVVAEKAMGEDGAESEICDNFVFLPHYFGITRIVAIAITGHTFKIGFIHRDPKHFEVLMTLTTGQEGNGYTLVRAAVNIGLWFRATMDRSVLHPLHFHFGIPSVTRNRHLTIYRHQFQKVLYQHGDINLAALSEFYKSLRSQRIPYFEYPVDDEGKADSVVLTGNALELGMKPVGLTRQPWTSDELKDCLVCILTALQELHGRGYVHLDLRWPNIITVEKGSWYIIDGEYVRKAGDPYPQNLPVHDGVIADHAVDLTMLGKMVGDLYNRDLIVDNVKALIEYLTKGDRSKRTAKDALLLVQGWCKPIPKPII